MNILILSNMYPSMQSKTYGIFVKNQAEALRERGHTVKVIAITSTRKGKWLTLSKYIRFFLEQWLHVLTKGKKYDVLHVHYVFPTGLFAPFFKRWMNAKLIVTAHGGDIDQMIHTHAFSRKQTEKILRQADRVIAVGERLKQDMIKHFHISPDAITVSSMGVNLARFKAIEKSVARQSLHIPTQQQMLLFVGNIIEKKGVCDLLQALKDQKDTHLYLVGEIKDQSFFDAIKETYLDKHEHFHFVGPIEQSELPRWFSAADAFVLPSHMEGLGLVAVEAMACHTPVIATDVGGLHYLLANETGIRVPAENPEALREAITAFFDLDCHQTFIQNGLIRVQEHDENKIIQDLITIYQ